jgi:hypothetical protein
LRFEGPYRSGDEDVGHPHHNASIDDALHPEEREDGEHGGDLEILYYYNIIIEVRYKEIIQNHSLQERESQRSFNIVKDNIISILSPHQQSNLKQFMAIF